MFKNLSIRKRILLILVTPFLGVFILSTLMVLENRATFQKSTHFQDYFEVSIASYNLVHELQKESGLSSSFILKRDKESKAALLAQRTLSDRMLKEYFLHTQEVLLINFPVELKESIAKSSSELKEISAIRLKVYRGELNLEKIIQYYSILNHDLLDYGKLLSNYSVNLELSKQLSSLNFLQKVKEKSVSIKEAVTHGLSENYFSYTLMEDIVHFLNVEETDLEFFINSINRKDLKKLDAMLEDPSFLFVKDISDRLIHRQARIGHANDLSRVVGYGGVIHLFKNYLLHGYASDKNNFEQHMNSLQKILKEYSKESHLEGNEKIALSNIKVVFELYVQAAMEVEKQLLDHMSKEKMDNLVKIDDQPAIKAIESLFHITLNIAEKDWYQASTKRIELINQSCLDMVANLNLEVQKIVDHSTQAIYIEFFVLSFFILFCVFIAWINSQVILRPLDRIQKMIEKFTQGDLNQRVLFREKNEITSVGEAINSLLDILQNEIFPAFDSLAKGDLTYHTNNQIVSEKIGSTNMKISNVISSVKLSTDSIFHQGRDIAEASQEVLDASVEQAAALEEISISMKEIVNNSKSNQSCFQEISRLAEHSKECVNKGNQQMSEMADAIRDIESSSRRISKMVKLVDNISFQTNLLSLNAAVEAARAGIHGKGFSVVAAEVRDLAQRSAKASGEISTVVENSIARINIGIELVKKTEDSLGEINKQSIHLEELILDVNLKNNQQIASTDELKLAIGQVASLSENFTWNSNQSAVATKVLMEDSMKLQKLVETFKTLKEEGQKKPSLEYASLELLQA